MKNTAQKHLSTIMTAALLTAASWGCDAAGQAESGVKVPQDPSKVQPALIGSRLPDIVLKAADGSSFDLNRAVAEKSAVLIFYRGGWCPYCNRHLADLRKIEDDLVKLGYAIYAVSADKPERVEGALKEHEYDYKLLSDNSMAAAEALGIAFRVDDKVFTKYKNQYNLDLEEHSGKTHHILPVPAVFIVDTDGIIRFKYVNPDYKVRASPEVILAAAKWVAER